MGEDGEAPAGFEAFVYYDMGKVPFGPLRELNASWGFRGGLHYGRVDLDSRSDLSTTLITTTDSFALGEEPPPSAPYTGSFEGPGILLGDSPSRSVVIGGLGNISGSRELDADVFITNLGPYVEIPLCERFSVTGEAGVSLGIASGSYEFESLTTVEGLGSQASGGRASSTRFLPGVYAGVSGIFRACEDWSVQLSGRYQYLKPFELEADGSNATLSFDLAFVISLGVLYSF